MTCRPGTRECAVVVIDDVCRFPLHVWRYLAESFAFGIGELREEDGRKIFGTEAEPVGLRTPGGSASVWWVDAGSQAWKKRLESVLGRIAPPRRFLVDVRGPSSGESARSGYRVERALDALVEGGVEVVGKSGEVLLVSSYEMISPPWRKKTPQGEKPSKAPVHLQVHPKAVETLDVLRQWVRQETEFQRTPARSDTERSSPPCLHVLVTGAGFEFAARPLGRLPQPGMPQTADLVDWALSDAAAEGRGLAYPPDVGAMSKPRPFQVYADHLALDTDDGRRHPLLEAARQADLDEYWNQLLQMELEREARRGTKTEPGPGAKHAATRREQQLREAFRGRFLRDDWGFLPQDVEAAALSWCAWLSTNYTRFADRAIDLWRTSASGQPRTGPWRIVSTSNEATQLIRELLHRRTADESQGTSRGEDDDPRYLFKLHGDVSHLTTMAIAGHDKDLYSPLSFPVDSLHHVYAAAELFLERTLERSGPRKGLPILWHVVGHGLKDRLLVELMARVVRRSEARHHHFVLVAPFFDETSPPDQLLRSALSLRRAAAAQANHPRIQRIRDTAAGYMAWLASRFRSEADDVEARMSLSQWREELRRHPFCGDA